MNDSYIAGVVHDWQLKFTRHGIDFTVDESLTDYHAVAFSFYDVVSKYAGTHFVSRLVIRSFKGNWQDAVWWQVLNRINDAKNNDQPVKD